jgi:hypothetical protein
MAEFTNLWRMYYGWIGNSHKILVKARGEYGPIVRTEPNIVVVDLPELIRAVLAVGRNFDGILRNAERTLDYFTLVATMPWLGNWLVKNPLIHIGPPGFGVLAAMGVARTVAQYQGTDSAFYDLAAP